MDEITNFVSSDTGKTVLAISGSLRARSFNRMLLSAAVRCAPTGMHIRVQKGLDAIPLFSEDLERDSINGPPSVRTLRREVIAADGLLIAPPRIQSILPGRAEERD